MIQRPASSAELWFTTDVSAAQASAFMTKNLPAFGGQARIRTLEADGNRFTVCPLWPLGYLPETPCMQHNLITLHVKF